MVVVEVRAGVRITVWWLQMEAMEVRNDSGSNRGGGNSGKEQ